MPIIPGFYSGGATLRGPTANGSSGQFLKSLGDGTSEWDTLPAGVTDHGALAGLADDDHAQYLLLAPTTDARNVIQPTAATVKALVLKGAVSQSDNLLEAQNSSGTALTKIDPSGNIVLAVNGQWVGLNVLNGMRFDPDEGTLIFLSSKSMYYLMDSDGNGDTDAFLVFGKGNNQISGSIEFAKFDHTGGYAFNDRGANADWRAEGDTDVNLLFLDASADTVQVGAATAADSAKFYVAGKISASGEVEINGALNHDGATVGLNGAAPVVQSTGWAVTNVTADKTFDANATTLDEIADVLGTLITYLISRGDLAA